jgi:predicted nucleic-acid-binding protein
MRLLLRKLNRAMHAIDTNVLVRLLTGDDVVQTKRVAALFKAEAIYVPKTVLLETEWVLRRLYGLERKTVVSAFRKVAGLANVEIENPWLINQALQWCDDGMDFADALHLSSSRSSEKFATFDVQLKKSAPKDIKQAVVLL